MPIPYVTPEQIEAMLAQHGNFVALPIIDSSGAAELVNRMLDELQGEQEL